MTTPAAALFPVPAPPRRVEVVEVEPPTPGQRRRERQLAAIAAGQHPLSLALDRSIPLHPDAAPAEPRDAEGARCGACQLRASLQHGAKRRPKCLAEAVKVQRRRRVGQGSYTTTLYPRLSHGEGTDVAAWFPACVDYQQVPDPSGERGRLDPDTPTAATKLVLDGTV